MRKLLLAALLATSLTLILPADESSSPPTPKLLLTPKLLRRLQRDRDRQTVRWVRFENRIKSTPDSPERGFELALHFAITADPASAQSALDWATAHPCERRQRLLIQDWVGPVPTATCPTPASLRDQAFEALLTNTDSIAIANQARTKLLPQITANGVPNSADLYALIELLSVLRTSTGNDIRNTDPTFFHNLPTEFLLSLKPQQVEHPDWLTHIAALALVSVDPNLEGSQFLQGWAMEDRQSLHDGPGVAYELLWADPYLPGIAYQNLDPWIYDEAGRFYARSDWTPTACWLSITKDGISNINCPKGWRDQPVQFGTLKLIPAEPKCMELSHQDSKSNLMIWNLTPGQSITYGDKHDKTQGTATADPAGLWHPGANVEGKVCRR